jgi:hypothetical protein
MSMCMVLLYFAYTLPIAIINYIFQKTQQSVTIKVS